MSVQDIATLNLDQHLVQNWKPGTTILHSVGEGEALGFAFAFEAVFTKWVLSLSGPDDPKQQVQYLYPLIYHEFFYAWTFHVVPLGILGCGVLILAKLDGEILNLIGVAAMSNCLHASLFTCECTLLNLMHLEFGLERSCFNWLVPNKICFMIGVGLRAWRDPNLFAKGHKGSLPHGMRPASKEDGICNRGPVDSGQLAGLRFSQDSPGQLPSAQYWRFGCRGQRAHLSNQVAA